MDIRPLPHVNNKRIKRSPKLPRPIYLLSPLAKEGVCSLPMISFETIVKQIDFQGCDTLMFTSKQAVVTAEEIDKRWHNYPSIAIGKATAGMIEALGGTLLYRPESFYGKTLSEEIAKIFRDRKILYLRPKEISFDAKSYLAKEGITLFEQIIYETKCLRYTPSQRPPKDAVIIFTSPSTIRCFLENFAWESSYTAVVIGQATLQHLPSGVDHVVVDRPLIDACITKAKEISLTSNPK